MRKNIFAAIAAAMIVASAVPVFAGSMADSLIPEAKAKEIALQNAGAEEKDAAFVRIAIDYKDGIPEYDLQFCVGDTEYDYDIDARTGEIRSMDHEIENGNGMTADTAQPAAQAQGPGSHAQTAVPTAPTAPAQMQTKRNLTKADALEIALGHAGFTKADVYRSRAERDFDDWAMVYEVRFCVGSMEYKYDIAASDGRILDFDAEYDD